MPPHPPQGGARGCAFCFPGLCLGGLGRLPGGSAHTLCLRTVELGAGPQHLALLVSEAWWFPLWTMATHVFAQKPHRCHRFQKRCGLGKQAWLVLVFSIERSRPGTIPGPCVPLGLNPLHPVSMQPRLLWGQGSPSCHPHLLNQPQLETWGRGAQPQPASLRGPWWWSWPMGALLEGALLL